MPNTETRASYDPYLLITEVSDILTAKGIPATVQPGQLGDALGGAGMLLRALCVAPTLDSITALERSAAKVWNDQD
jgi:hypothetical protein